MKGFPIILFLGLISFPAASQDSTILLNNISIAPLVILDRTIPFSYSRYMNDNWNFTFYARYRIGKDDGTTIEQGMIPGDKLNQPYIYSRVYIRSGFQYHKKLFLAEPLLQFDYGWLRDQSVEIYESDESGIYELQDRDYYSAGVIILTGTYHNFKTLRIRNYVGIGSHLKYFQVHAKEGWNADPEGYPYYEEYYKFMLSFHLGIEIGINF